MLYSVNANFELTNANNVILIQIDDIFAEISMYMYICMWKYLSSENKVIKDDNHVILILIYDIFAENLMDVETELSNEIGFIKVDNSGLEVRKNFVDCIMRITDEIRGRNKKDLEWFGSQWLVLYICYLHYVNFVLLMDTKPVISGLSLLSN